MGTALADKGRRGVVSLKGDAGKLSSCVRKVTLRTIAQGGTRESGYMALSTKDDPYIWLYYRSSSSLYLH